MTDDKTEPSNPKEEDQKWRSPTICEVLSASVDYENSRRFATIERRIPANQPLRLKIVIFGDTVADLQKIARRVGIFNFQNFGKWQNDG